jgi:heavy metal translocating P-type ATPase
LIGLFAGFIQSFLWILIAIIGLALAINWALEDLRNNTMSSDILAILAIIGTLITDESFAGAVITLMLATGRLLEKWAEGQAERQLKSLLERVPRSAHRKNQDGSLTEVPINEIRIGDRILVRTGEIVPTDGNLLTAGTFDESALTGEPLPQNHAIGAYLPSGVLNAGVPAEYEATTTSAESAYAAIIKLVQEAQKKTAPGIRIANTWALRFVPLALFIAGCAWYFSGEMSYAVSVLVAATPCPLILAVPIAIVSGLSRSAKHGAVIKSGAILESLSRTEVVLLDKTGTLTHGGPAVTSIQGSDGYSQEAIMEIAGGIDQYSPHIVAKALVEYCVKNEISLPIATELEENPGHSISGIIGSHRYQVGQIVGKTPNWFSLREPLLVGIYKDGEFIGGIGLEDPIRLESKTVIDELSATGVKTIAMLTGDRTETAQLVAAETGIKEVFAELKPEQKLAITEKFCQETSGTVVLVGDGINDAPALALADVGVAMGARGASAASEAADVIIVEDSIDRLTKAISIAKTSRAKAMQAAGIGMFLSFVAMLTGAFGITNASEGALIQEVIDVIAILWALTALKAN